MTWVIDTLWSRACIKIGTLTIVSGTLSISSVNNSSVGAISSWSSCVGTISTTIALSKAWFLTIHINVSLFSKIMRLILLHHEILLVLDIFLLRSSSLLHFSFISILGLLSLLLSLLSCLLLSKYLISLLLLFYLFFLILFISYIL